MPPPAKSRDEDAEVPGRFERVPKWEWGAGHPAGFGTPNCSSSPIPKAFQGDTNVSFLTETLIRNGSDKCRRVAGLEGNRRLDEKLAARCCVRVCTGDGAGNWLPNCTIG